MRSSLTACGILLVAVAGVACGGDGGATGNPPIPTAITILVSSAPDNFGPSTDTVAVGGTVTWAWAPLSQLHNINSDGPPAFTDEPGPATYNAPHTYGPLTFSTAGAYNYHCSVHGGPGTGMHGTIVVQ
jgi:plastocyanin